MYKIYLCMYLSEVFVDLYRLCCLFMHVMQFGSCGEILVAHINFVMFYTSRPSSLMCAVVGCHLHTSFIYLYPVIVSIYKLIGAEEVWSPG